MSDLMDIVNKLEELNEAEQELIVLMAEANKVCSLLLILHMQREEQIKRLSTLQGRLKKEGVDV